MTNRRRAEAKLLLLPAVSLAFVISCLLRLRLHRMKRSMPPHESGLRQLLNFVIFVPATTLTRTWKVACFRQAMSRSLPYGRLGRSLLSREVSALLASFVPSSPSTTPGTGPLWLQGNTTSVCTRIGLGDLALLARTGQHWLVFVITLANSAGFAPTAPKAGYLRMSTAIPTSSLPNGGRNTGANNTLWCPMLIGGKLWPDSVKLLSSASAGVPNRIQDMQIAGFLMFTWPCLALHKASRNKGAKRLQMIRAWRCATCHAALQEKRWAAVHRCGGPRVISPWPRSGSSSFVQQGSGLSPMSPSRASAMRTSTPHSMLLNRFWRRIPAVASDFRCATFNVPAVVGKLPALFQMLELHRVQVVALEEVSIN